MESQGLDGFGSFEAAFERCFPQAVALTRRIVGSHAAAEDLAAEALLRAFERWSSLKTAGHLDAWIMRVATNLALDHVRRASVLECDTVVQGLDDLICARHVLVAAVRTLPRRQREVVALRFFAGLDERECAATLGVSPGSVKQHLHRALSTLRGWLSSDDWPSALDTGPADRFRLVAGAA